MRQILARGPYRARIAESAADVRRAQGLRHLCFRRGPGMDADGFDAACDHVLVEDVSSGQLVCCFRLLALADGAEIGRSYSAQFYGLGGLRRFDGRMLEMGRFCIAPGCRDGDVLRLAWAAMTRVVDDRGVEMLFGCTSFPGTEAQAYNDTFDLLAAEHLAPGRWRPQVKGADVVRFRACARRGAAPDRRGALRRMPPLLRTYLVMGGWVSDHAVVDRELNTLHVFTGLEIRAVPAARARALRMIAG
ncbi:GNAT family N-acetyltransferase [Roseisalinus antarcticus]|uniref:L-ornithine N(alpha)-acyltransferase n=1 Tax=Roseisalinus antarcticus TaxID=254357 RepID=A0A1Y5RKS0_9RHOB|nr:GNAT family N-acetyltransferase [Roseisalinus antarcticus]SLN18841.1 hypothetical protein ROA7023_00415 [Roseisalinus antarcticus]